jgi:hypothetical protein
MFYSAQHAGFFHPDIHGTAIPADAVEIDDVTYSALIDAQTQGAVIQPDAQGVPIAVFPTPLSDAEMRQAWRTTATVDRASFLKALVGQSILPGAEAVAAARGEWPVTFSEALDALPIDPVAAQIDWASAATISRGHPLFLAVLEYHASEHELAPEAALELGDLIFGFGPLLPPAPD